MCMNMRLWLVVLALIAPGVSAIAQTEDGGSLQRLGLTVRGWRANLDGDTSLITNLIGDRLDLDRKLGIDDEDSLDARIRLQLTRNHALVFRYVYLDFSGENTVVEPLLFEGELAGLASYVESDIELHYGRVGWRWSIIGDPTERFHLDTVLDAAVFSLDASAKHYDVWNYFVPEEHSFDGTIGLPVVGLGFNGRPTKYLEVFGEFAGMYAGDYGHLFDAEAGLRLPFGDHFAIEGGYRWFAINGRFGEFDDLPLVPKLLGAEEEKEADLTMEGPFVGVSIRF
jgi:hypothetical protein